MFVVNDFTATIGKSPCFSQIFLVTLKIDRNECLPLSADVAV